MKSEESIKLQGNFGIAASWRSNRNLLANVVIIAVSEGHDHGDTVGGATLKYCYNDRPVLGYRACLSKCGPQQERRSGGKSCERETTGFNKKTAIDHNYSDYLL